MTDQVLAAIDGSQYAEGVCDYAAWASLAMDAPLTFVHVVDNHSEVPEEQNLSGNLRFGARERLMKELSDLDEQRAKVNRERFHRDGKVITGAGVSASVDAALFLAGLLGGEALARTLQLGIEYYPQPPFGNGTPDEAPAGAQALVRRFEEDGAHRIASLRPPV